MQVYERNVIKNCQIISSFQFLLQLFDCLMMEIPVKMWLTLH